MEKVKKKPCPFCKGSGKVVKIERVNTYKEEIAEKAVALRREGHTLREIAKKLKYKHPQSVAHLINKWYQRHI